MNTSPVNPITLEVVCESLRAIVKEMRASIIRASFSSAIYELDDFSCALFNPAADMVAQSDDHPGHVMPMPWSVVRNSRKNKVISMFCWCGGSQVC